MRTPKRRGRRGRDKKYERNKKYLPEVSKFDEYYKSTVPKSLMNPTHKTRKKKYHHTS